MKSMASLFSGALLVSLLCSISGSAQSRPPVDKSSNPNGEKIREPIIDMSSNPSGEKIRGPREVTIKHINRIKYDVSVGLQTTPLTGISLDLPFFPALSKGKPATPTEGKPETLQKGAEAVVGLMKTARQQLNLSAVAAGGEGMFQRVHDKLKDVEENDIRSLIDRVLGITRDAIDSTQSLVHDSDNLIRGDESHLKDRLKAAIDVIKNARDEDWPDLAINETLGFLAVAKLQLRDISDEGWLSKPINKTRYDADNDRIDQLTTRLEALKSNEDRAKFDDARQKLRLWQEIFGNALNNVKSYFTQTVTVPCGFSVINGEEKKIKVTRKNRLDAKADTETLEPVTVVCSPLLSISSGVGFSALNERDIAFVQSIKTTTDSSGNQTQTLVNRFGYSGNSSFRSLPVLFVNTKLRDLNDEWSIHGAIGAAVDLNGQLGADAEFIIGPSLSFNRLLFITPGLHMGRASRLAGGFQIGDEVPAGVEAPPIEKVWKPGFAVTFTIRIK